MIGTLRERVTLQTAVAAAYALASLTRSSTTATATTKLAHGYTTGDYVTVAGATPSAYNGRVKITVTGTTTFTYTVAGSPATPATGTITATYTSDAQLGRKAVWRDVATVSAALIPVRASERLQASAVTAVTDLRFKIHTRAGVVPSMRATWTPTWPPGATAQTLQILGVLPEGDGRAYLVLECGAVTG
jgi:head-tail adaptor